MINIKGIKFPDYYASLTGAVHKRGDGESQPVQARDDGRGYLCVTLIDEHKKRRTYKLHHVVMEAFKGPTPKGYHIDHKDHDKTNNALANLRWRKASENSADCSRSANTTRRKLTEEGKLALMILLDHGFTTKQVADVLCIGQTSVRRFKRQLLTPPVT